MSEMNEVVRDAFEQKQLAERRLWAARDRAVALKEQAALAAVDALTAERDLQRTQDWLRQVWGDWREDVEGTAQRRIPSAQYDALSADNEPGSAPGLAAMVHQARAGDTPDR